MNHDRLLRDDIGVTDDDIRAYLEAAEAIDACGPSLRDDFLSAVGVAINRYRRDRVDAMWQNMSGIFALASGLTRLFSIGMDRATLLAKEHLCGSPRKALHEVIEQYLELAESERDKRRERERAIDAERQRRANIASRRAS